MNVYYWKSKSIEDSRGIFSKIAVPNAAKYIDNFVLQDLFLTKSRKNVIRGMHLQVKEFSSNRIIHVSKGKINDLLLDLRGVKSREEITRFNEQIGPECEFDSIYVPAGVAHGFETLEEAEIIYLSDKVYSFTHDTGINPLSINFTWINSEPIISERDLNLPTLEEFLE
jgi:dTDP-4-dehydrorhamnose 3,5-epimerase